MIALRNIVLALVFITYTASSLSITRQTADMSSSVAGVTAGALASYATYRWLKPKTENQEVEEQEHKQEDDVDSNLVSKDSQTSSDEEGDFFFEEEDDLDLILGELDEGGISKKKSFGLKRMLAVVAVGVAAGWITKVAARMMLSNVISPNQSLGNCAICLEDLINNVVQTRCNRDSQNNSQRHRFHRSCIETWLGDNYNCPLCKGPAAIYSLENVQ